MCSLELWSIAKVLERTAKVLHSVVVPGPSQTELALAQEQHPNPPGRAAPWKLLWGSVTCKVRRKVLGMTLLKSDMQSCCCARALLSC